MVFDRCRPVVLKRFKISTLRSPKIFFYHSRSFIFKHKFPRKIKKSKKKVITFADVQSSTIQWGNLSKIRDLFGLPLKLLCRPQENRGPQFESYCCRPYISKQKSISFFKGSYPKHYWSEACVNSILRFR